ncbi:Uncharacterised protein [Mycobacteroides abscessus subsp. abscessus]|nr:Uncharacterised protein [Mycobacteroides abscessus subsp. abscessus]
MFIFQSASCQCGADLVLVEAWELAPYIIDRSDVAGFYFLFKIRRE